MNLTIGQDARIVRADASHVGGISAIYGEAVHSSVASFDYVAPDESHWLAKIESSAAGDHFFVALDVAAHVAGFAYSGSFRARPGYALTKESSIYLRADARGSGLGLRMYSQLMAAVRASGGHTVVAVIAEPNPASSALHSRLGFERVGTLAQAGFKFGEWVDTTYFQLRWD